MTPKESASERTLAAAACSILRCDPWRMRCLRAVRSLCLNDAYIAAGFVRNAIWDAQHDYWPPTPLNDVDVVYFDRDTALSEESRIQSSLVKAVPDASWEVKNQARMHSKHGHAPYTDTKDAIARWIEAPTCVGARLAEDDAIEIVAPFGLASCFSLRVSINPQFPRIDIYQQRLASKQWQKRWPQLSIEKTHDRSTSE